MRRPLSIAAFTGFVLILGTTYAEEPRRPNVIFLMTDDQRQDCLSLYDHPLLETPNIDRLAAEGLAFDKAFVTTSICAVSRASFYTGMYARTHQVPDFATPLPQEALAASFPAQLKAAGYRTGCLGKWGLGGPAPREVFDVWNAWGGQGNFFEEIDGERLHNSEFLARWAVEFLEENPKDQPFALMVLYKAPHDPFEPDPRDESLYQDDTVTESETYTDAAFEAMPGFIQESEGRTRLEQRHPTPEAFQEFAKRYFQCVAGVDRSVGQILDALEDQGLAENTIVVFTSDHGFFLGEHGLSGKWLMHEESIRIPFVVRAPGIIPERVQGRRLDPIVLNIDLAPTVLDLAGVPIPEATDGLSLAPWLRGETPDDWREDFFYEHHFHYNGRIPRTEGVRSEDWKYITYFDVDPPFEELYDLRNDPLEQRNLAVDPAHREQLDALKTRYREYVETLPPAVVPNP